MLSLAWRLLLESDHQYMRWLGLCQGKAIVG